VALVALTVGGLFFPPTAVLGAMVMKQSGIGEPHELIIAVDAQRTHNLGELESALGQGRTGRNRLFDGRQRRPARAGACESALGSPSSARRPPESPLSASNSFRFAAVA